MRRVRFEPEVDTKRQVILSTDLRAMQDGPAEYVHKALKSLNLTSSTGAGLRIKIFGLQAIPASTPDETVTITEGTGATGGAKDEDSPIVELAASKEIFILDETNIITEVPDEVKKNSIVFASDLTATSPPIEPGFKVKEFPAASEKTVIALSGIYEVVVEEDMTPDASPSLAASIRKPGKAADATLPRIDTISIGPVTVETDDSFANTDESRTFIDVNVKEGAAGRETAKNIRTRYDDAFVIYVRQGEPAVSPVPATVPADELPIANVTVGAGVTVINESDIADIDEGATQFDDRFPVTFFDIVAAENLEDFDVIRIRSTDGQALKADYLSRENSKVIGIIPLGGAITISTNPKGEAAHFGIFTKIGAGFQAGRHLYLLADGKFGHEEAFIAPGEIHKVPVGMAITTEKFMFFGGRRVMAQDIPLADTAGNFSSDDVEGALAELSVGAGIAHIGSSTTVAGTGATVGIPANGAPELLFVVMSCLLRMLGTDFVRLHLGGTGLDFPGTSEPLQMGGYLHSEHNHRVTQCVSVVLKAGVDYDSSGLNTLSLEGDLANTNWTHLDVFGK